MLRKARPKVKSLLGGDTEPVAEVDGGPAGAGSGSESEPAPEQDAVVNYWKPTLALHLVHDFQRFPTRQLPETIKNGPPLPAASPSPSPPHVC